MSYLELLKDPRWQKRRLEILERDGWECQNCGGKDKTLHVHHKRYRGKPWETRANKLKIRTPSLAKFKRLQRRLGLVTYECVGLLETLWWVTAQNAPQGDIGRLGDEEIAAMVEWRGDAVELVKALTETHWLEPSERHRLLVHDWADHCPRWVRSKLGRADQEPISHINTVATVGATAVQSVVTSVVPSVEASVHPTVFSPLLSSPPPLPPQAGGDYSQDSSQDCSPKPKRKRLTKSQREARIGRHSEPASDPEKRTAKQQRIRTAVRQASEASSEMTAWISAALDRSFRDVAEATADFETFRLEHKQATP